MPNVRGKDQIFIGFQADAELLREIEAMRGGLSRSHFVREAVAEKLRGMGINVAEQLVNPPDRAGKGGPKKGGKQVVKIGKKARVGKVVQKKRSTTGESK